MEWMPVTEARYWEMLEVLPPAVMAGDGFLVGEPVSHNADGQPTFAAFRKQGEQHYESAEAMTIAQFLTYCPGATPYAYSLSGEYL